MGTVLTTTGYLSHVITVAGPQKQSVGHGSGSTPPPPQIGRRQGVLYSRRGCIGIDRYMEVRRQPLFPGPALTSATADRLRHADRSTASVHMEKRDLLQVGRLVLAYSTEVLRLG